MRRVDKQLEPEDFARWKTSDDPNWKPTYADLQNPEKASLHESLISEQGQTCCYCGREIKLSDSHIEHFWPRSHFKLKTLDYENLFASCGRENKQMPQFPETCGVSKGEWYSKENYVSPLQPDCEQHFRYTLAGDIHGVTPVGQQMIAVLGLEQSFLTNRRQKALEGVFDDDFLASAQEQDLQAISVNFRSPDEEGKVAPFFQVVCRYAEQLLATAKV